MDKKYKNKYRIPSARLQTWDYGWNAAYFVTICTYKRKHFFGKIINGKMHLSEFGKIAHTYWNSIPEHFPFIELGEFIAMPDHIHGIIIINKSGNAAGSKMAAADNDTPVQNDSAAVQTPKLGVSSVHPNDDPNPAADLPIENFQSNPNPKKSKSGGKNKQWKPGTLGVILNQYKRICTINSRKIDPNFDWQERFHDSIIWDEQSFRNISRYIKNNPAKWKGNNFNGSSEDK